VRRQGINLILDAIAHNLAKKLLKKKFNIDFYAIYAKNAKNPLKEDSAYTKNS